MRMEWIDGILLVICTITEKLTEIYIHIRIHIHIRNNVRNGNIRKRYLFFHNAIHTGRPFLLQKEWSHLIVFTRLLSFITYKKRFETFFVTGIRIWKIASVNCLHKNGIRFPKHYEPFMGLLLLHAFKSRIIQERVASPGYCYSMNVHHVFKFKQIIFCRYDWFHCWSCM